MLSDTVTHPCKYSNAISTVWFSSLHIGHCPVLLQEVTTCWYTAHSQVDVDHWPCNWSLLTLASILMSNLNEIACALDGVSSHFKPGERASGTHWIGYWVRCLIYIWYWWDSGVEFIHWLVFWTEQTICELGFFPLSHKYVQRCPLSGVFSGWVQLHTFPPED